MPKLSRDKLIEELMQSNVSLQKKSTDLLVALNNLTKKVDSLLKVFEKAAEEIKKGEVAEPLTKRLEALIEQNRTIARGLLLIEKYVREKAAFSSQPSPPRKLAETEF